MSRPPFPFTRLSGLGPLPRLFEAMEGATSLNRLLAGEDIHLDRMTSGTIVPFLSLNEVFNRATRLSGDVLFPIRVAQAMRPEDYGPMVEFALAAPTLGAAIRRICRLTPLHSSANGFVLRADGRSAEWLLRYDGVRGLRIGHHALHILVPMVAFVQRYAGSPAGPVVLQLAGSGVARGAIENAIGSPVRDGATDFGIVFPAEWLALARPGPPPGPTISFADTIRFYRGEALPRSTRDTVEVLLRPIVGLADIDLDAIAGRLNTSRRTLQQRLNAEGSNFRDIALGVRVTRAKELMLGGDAAIAQVALSVGYSDQAHFTRAFKTMTGLTPQEFRRLNRPGMMDAAE